MKTALNVTVVALVAIVISGYALAQLKDPPVRRQVGNYTVTVVGDSAVMLDGTTGQTWLLQHSRRDNWPSVWLPIQRIDNERQVAAWRAKEWERSNQQLKGRLNKQLQLNTRELQQQQEILGRLRQKARAAETQPMVGRVKRRIKVLEQHIAELKQQLEQLDSAPQR